MFRRFRERIGTVVAGLPGYRPVSLYPDFEIDVDQLVPHGITESELRKEFSPLLRGRPSKGEPLDTPGMYRIVAIQSDRIMYIGYTGHLATRKKEHTHKCGYDKAKYYNRVHHFYWQGAKFIEPHQLEQMLRDHEAKQILKHKPPHNDLNKIRVGRPWGLKLRNQIRMWVNVGTGSNILMEKGDK